MRVLHIVPSLDPETGGPARSVPSLCRALHQWGIEVALYTFRRAGAMATVSSESEPFSVEWFQPIGRRRQFPTTTFFQRLRQSCASFDLVHLHGLWSPAISLAASVCRWAGVPYIVSPRGMLQRFPMSHRRWLKQMYWWVLECRTCDGAHAAHFLNHAEANESQSFFRSGIPFFVVPNGIDSFLGHRVEQGRFRGAYPALRDKLIMLFLGRLHWSKGLDLQAEAFALLAKEFPTLTWLLVGPDAGGWTRILRKLAWMGLQERVFLTGLLPGEERLEALADADVFVQTSKSGGLSMAVNEALAVGVPIVVTDSANFPEIQEAGAGFVVQWEPNALAQAIAYVLSHPAKSAQMRNAGRKLVAERLAWPQIAGAMVSAYEEIKAGSSARVVTLNTVD